MIQCKKRALYLLVLAFFAMAPASLWAQVSVTPQDSTAGEGNGDTGAFAVTLNPVSLTATTVNYTVAGTATSAADYTALSGSVVVPANQQTATITVNGLADSLIEPDETVEITLTGTDNPLVTVDPAADTATVTIVDVQTGTVKIVATDADADESGGNGGQYEVILETASVTDTVISGEIVTTGASGEATSADVVGAISSVTIPAGSTSAFIDVNIFDDAIVEPDETLTVRLTGTDNPKIFVTSDQNSDHASIIIAADSNDTAQLTVENITVPEGGTFSFMITLDNEVSGGFTIDPDAVSGTALKGVDYSIPGGQLTFSGAPGESHVFSVDTVDDAIVEETETFTVSLNNLQTISAPAGAVDFTDTAVGTITDNDTATIVLADTAVDEGDNLVIEATLDHAVQGGLTVDVQVADTTTTVNDDYTFPPTTLTFTGTENEVQVITIPTVQDTVVESNETLNVSLNNLQTTSAPAGAIDVTNTAVGTITDNDTATIVLADTAVDEGDNLVIEATLDHAVQGGLTVDVQVADTTTTVNDDYTFPPTTLTFTGTENEVQVITIPTVQDTVVESNETLNVSLNNLQTTSAPAGAIDVTNTAVGTITDNDTATIVLEDTAVYEGDNLVLGATLDHAVQGGLTVDVQVLDNTTTVNVDYTFAPTTLTFSGTENEVQVITIPTVQDAVVEPDETLNVSLENLQPASLASSIDISSTATGEILNDDYVIAMHAGDDGSVITSAGGGATTPPDSSIIVSRNETPSFTIAPNDSVCHHIEDVLVNGASVGQVSTYTFDPVTEDQSISASFAINTYDVTVNVLEQSHGTVTQGETVNCAGDYPITITADSGYTISYVKLDGVDEAAAAHQKTYSLNLTNIHQNQVVEVAFSQHIEVVEVSPFGSITPSGAGNPVIESVDYDGNLTFAISAHADSANPLAHNGREHHLSDILIDGSSVGGVQGAALVNYSYDFQNVIHNHSIEALFTSFVDVTVDGQGTVSTSDGFALTNSGNGTVDDSYEVESGATATLNIEPAAGFHVSRLDSDGETRGYASSWSFSEVVDTDHTLHVWFSPNRYTLDPVSNFHTIFSDSNLTTQASALTPLYHHDGTFYVKLTEPNNYDYSIVVAKILVDNVEYSIPPIIPANFGVEHSYPATDPYFTITLRKNNTPSDPDYVEYLEVKFTNIEHSHRLEVLDYDGTPLADVPLDTRIQPQPATIMFVMDDSGSMDFEFMVEGGVESLYGGDSRWWKNALYLWPTSDRLYHYSNSVLNDAGKRDWRSQWSGYNKMYYNPSVHYDPWPTFFGHDLEDCDGNLTDHIANACLDKPRSHPWHNEGDANKIDMNATWLDLSSGSGPTYTTVFTHDEDHEISSVGGHFTLDINVDHDHSRIHIWTTFASPTTDMMARILNGAGDEYRANEYADSWSAPYDDGNSYDDDSGDQNPDFQLSDVDHGAYTIDLRAYSGGTGHFILHVLVEELQAPDKLIINAHYFSKDDTGQVYLVNITDPVEYYKVGTNGSITAADLTRVTDLTTIPPEVTYYPPTGSGTPGDVYQAERQNFVNWFSYYRKRELAATAAIATFIKRVDNVFIGFNSINHKLVSAPRPVDVVEDLQLKNDRTDILRDLYSMVLESNGTPLLKGLQEVGKFYQTGDSNVGSGDSFVSNKGIDPPGNDPVVSPFATNEDGDECKQVFAIVMTDGFWNGVVPAAIGDEDGDGVHPWLSDVAEKFYSMDMSATLNDEVPGPRNTQHMVTYTVAFGVKGHLDLAIDPPLDSNNHPLTKNSPHWRDGNDKDDKIDDLWHAAFNGGGKFLSASRPDKLVDALLFIMDDIMGGKIGSGASVSINGDQFFQVINDQVRMYQSNYNSDYWTGDIRSFSFEQDNNGFTGNRLLAWSAQNVFDSEMTNGFDLSARNIVTYDWGSDTTDGHGIPFVYGSLTPEQQKYLVPYFNRDRSAQDVLNFLRGSRDYVSTNDFRKRLTKHFTWKINTQSADYSVEDEEAWFGDFVNSRPIFSDSLVYAGSNDGMLHAFVATGNNQGKELFAYIPNLVFDNLRELPKPDYRHLFYVDGKLKTHKVDNSNNHDTYLVGSLGKGGKGYYCLNITGAKSVSSADAAAALINWEYPHPVADSLILEKNTFSFEVGTGAGGNDRILDSGNGLSVFSVGDYIRVIGTVDSTREITNDGSYRITAVANGGSSVDVEAGHLVAGVGNSQDIIVRKTTSDPDMGYSYTKPVLARSNQVAQTNAQSIDYVDIAILANGYGSESGTASLKIVNLVTGELIRTLDTGVGPFNGLSTPAAIDVDNDLRVDYVYAGDLRGNMWKFDLSSSDPAQWQVAFCDGGDSTDHCLAAGAIPKPLFAAGSHQAITGAPDVMRHQSHTGYMVIFGTGKYLGMADLGNVDTQSVYGIWDWAPDAFDTGYLGARIDNTAVTPPVAELSNWPLTDVGGNMVNTLLRQEIWCEGNLTFAWGTGYFRVPSNYKGNWDLVQSNHLPPAHHVFNQQVDVDGDGDDEYF